MRIKLSFLFLLALLTVPALSPASFKSAVAGIDGLTCSMCANSAERLIRQLDFVASVEMDLNETVAKIRFKPGKTVHIQKIAQKIIDAGYSVRYLKAVFDFEPLKVSNHFSYSYEEGFYNFVNIKERLLSGEVELTFVGKLYVPRKDFFYWEGLISEDKKINKTGKNSYYVTL